MNIDLIKCDICGVLFQRGTGMTLIDNQHKIYTKCHACDRTKKRAKK